MSIVMRTDASQDQINAVIEQLESSGLQPHLFHGEERSVIAVVGDDWAYEQEHFSQLDGVDRVIQVSRPYKLASREFYPQNSRFALDEVQIGGEGIVIFASQNSIESREQLLETAWAIQGAGAHAICIEAGKQRPSPYALHEINISDLELLAEVRETVGLPVVLEVTSVEQIQEAAQYVHMLQISAANMQNFSLLKAAGKSQLPVLLKRGVSATIEELLMAAEFILAHGNHRVVLCEGGIRTFDNTSLEAATRNTTDINAIPVLRTLTHLPVILDPSHSTGHWKYVGAIACAGIAAGADGLSIEVHSGKSSLERTQSLKMEHFTELIQQAKAVARAVGRDL